MYTNGYTGQKYLSLIAVTTFDGTSADVLPLGSSGVFTGVLTTREFERESEHVTLGEALTGGLYVERIVDGTRTVDFATSY